MAEVQQRRQHTMERNSSGKLMYAPQPSRVFCQSNPQMAVRPDHPARHFKPIDSAKSELGWPADLPPNHPDMKIGIVIQRRNRKERYRNIMAMLKTASSCQIAQFVFLGENADLQPPLSVWIDNHKSEDQKDGDVSYSHGDEGYAAMLKRPDIGAVYIVVPPGMERKYIVMALEAKKHVLVKDPVSTYLGEFIEQLRHSKKHGKFIQFSTMFIHQYRVQKLVGRVLREELFGRINSIDAHLLLNYDEVRKVGVQLPLDPHSGCIRTLGRYCILFSVLVFARVGSTAVSAQVHTYEKGSNGELQNAECTVKFSNDRVLTFTVGFTNSNTRQSIAVKADASVATMEDFVIEHPDGLASYRVYEKGALRNGKAEILSGEAVDVAGGPTQDTMMWRTFVRLSSLIDEYGWDHPMTAECQELADVAMQTKLILLALLNSVEMGCKDVPLTKMAP